MCGSDLQTLHSTADTISHLGQPSLEYFKDHSASQVIDDFLGFANNPIASLLILGPDGIVSTSPAGRLWVALAYLWSALDGIGQT